MRKPPTHARESHRTVGTTVRTTLDRIYREHRQGLFTFALSITRDRDRAEDAVHEAFTRLCRLEAPPTGDPVAYTYAAVRNAATDELRRGTTRGKLAKSIYNGYLPTQDPDRPDDDVLDEERQRLVRNAIEQLPDPARQTLVMRLYAGLTFDQIAQALDEPLGTITSRYRRSLDKLKEHLTELH